MVNALFDHKRVEEIRKALERGDPKPFRSKNDGAAPDRAGLSGGQSADGGLLRISYDTTAEHVEKLLKEGADPNARDENGATLLMQAVSAFNEVSRWTVFELHSNPVVLSNTRPLAQLEKIVELLLAHGADPYAKDSEGNDVFHQKRFSNHMPRSLERFAR